MVMNHYNPHRVAMQGEDPESGEPSLDWISDMNHAKHANMPDAMASMWPPTKAEARWMGLERCLRLFPRDN